MTLGHCAGSLPDFYSADTGARGSRTVRVPLLAGHDLRELDAVPRMLADARPHIVIHVDGIGANREKPAEFFGACPEPRPACRRPQSKGGYQAGQGGVRV